MSTIDEILENFRDIVVRVPSMYSLSPSWHSRVAPDLDGKVEEHIESWRQRWLLEPTVYKQNLAADCGYFARATSPNANLANLQIGARFITWLFAWDDALDLGSFSDGARQRELIRIEVLRIIQKCLLGTTVEEEPSDWGDMPPTFAESFYDIGFSHQKGTKLEPLQQFFCDQLCRYVERAVRVEDAFQENIIMDLDVYLESRLENSGSYPLIGLALIARDIALPAWFLNHPIPREMMRHINIMLSLQNDIVSAGNELRHKHVDNIVPLLVYHRGFEPQKAVDFACQMINDSYTTFESLVPNVFALASNNGLAEEGQIFVTSCKDIYVGVTSWVYKFPPSDQRVLDFNLTNRGRYYIKRYHDFRLGEEQTEAVIPMSL